MNVRQFCNSTNYLYNSKKVAERFWLGSFDKFSGLLQLFIFCLLALTITAKKSKAQCKAMLPFDAKACAEITDIFQFSFLHFPEKNRLDSLVFQLNYPRYVRDSAFYRWPADKSSVSSVLDIFDGEAVVREIGRLKSAEAFCILSIPYIFKENSSLRSPHLADDLSPFNSFIDYLPVAGAAKVINKYFLDEKIDTNLPKEKFEQEVISASLALRKKYFSPVRYCQLLGDGALQMAIMGKHDPAVCDSAVLSLIRKYASPNGQGKVAFPYDSVMIDLLALKGVIDAENDHCLSKPSHATGGGEYNFGVIYAVPARYPWDDHESIQRVYRIHYYPNRKPDIFIVGFDLDFVSRIRNRCPNE